MKLNCLFSRGSRRREEADHGAGSSDASSLTGGGDALVAGSVLRRFVNDASSLQARSAFTLVEIALSIAIIGFALVAIIGVLPAGLNVQRENREETIIVNDANYFLDAIRSGARGLDHLTNFVESITVVQTSFNDQTNEVPGSRTTFHYTYTDYRINNVSQGEPDLSLNTLTNGQRIVGLLSTPKYVYPPPPPPATGSLPPGTTRFDSNYVFAYVRALSGPAVEKPPQQNAAVRDLSFRYRLLSEVIPFRNWATNWVDAQYAQNTGLSAADVFARSNYWRTAQMLQHNMHEVRLIFRWPIKANGDMGNQRQVFRTLVGGTLTNQAYNRRWFVQPGTFQIPL